MLDMAPTIDRCEISIPYQMPSALKIPFHYMERVPKIIAINSFFKLQSAFLIISNHNSFRVLFDKIASVYFMF